MRTLVFIALILASALAFKSNTETEAKYTFHGKTYTMAQLNKILEDQIIWPKDMKERYSRRVLVGGPECKAYFSCRDNQESKDTAYCLASKQLDQIEKMPAAIQDGADQYQIFSGAGANTIYYAETQKKTGSTNDYNQYLFARLPTDYMNFYEQQKNGDSNLKLKYKAFLFTICVPVNINEEAIAFGHCVFDTCQALISRMQAELIKTPDLRANYQSSLEIPLAGFSGVKNSIIDSNKDEIFGVANDQPHKDRMAECDVKYNEENVETTYIFAFQQDLKNAKKRRDDKAKGFRFMQTSHKTSGFKIKVGDDKSHFVSYKNVLDPKRCANKVNLKKID